MKQVHSHLYKTIKATSVTYGLHYYQGCANVFGTFIHKSHCRKHSLSLSLSKHCIGHVHSAAHMYETSLNPNKSNLIVSYSPSCTSHHVHSISHTSLSFINPHALHSTNFNVPHSEVNVAIALTPQYFIQVRCCCSHYCLTVVSSVGGSLFLTRPGVVIH